MLKLERRKFAMAAFMLLMAIFSLNPALTWAIVDVHDQYYAAPEAEVLSAWSFDFSGASGNDARQDFAIETHNLWRSEQRTWMLIGRYARADSGGSDTADNRFLHARFVNGLTERSGIEVFLQTQQDRFQKLDRRHLIGAGYRFERQGDDESRLLFGLGGLAERERYVGLKTTESSYRANLYMTAEIPVALAVPTSFSLSGYLQPKFDDFGDLRSIAVARFKTQLTDALALDITVAIDHDSNPISGVDAQNVRYSSGITYTFQR